MTDRTAEGEVTTRGGPIDERVAEYNACKNACNLLLFAGIRSDPYGSGNRAETHGAFETRVSDARRATSSPKQVSGNLTSRNISFERSFNFRFATWCTPIQPRGVYQ